MSDDNCRCVEYILECMRIGLDLEVIFKRMHTILHSFERDLHDSLPRLQASLAEAREVARLIRVAPAARVVPSSLLVPFVPAPSSVPFDNMSSPETRAGVFTVTATLPGRGRARSLTQASPIIPLAPGRGRARRLPSVPFLAVPHQPVTASSFKFPVECLPSRS